MPIPEEERPPAGRVILGFFVAAFAAVGAMAVLLASAMSGASDLGGALGFSIFVFLFGVPVALIAIAVLALPAYLLMRRHWHVRWWNAGLTGFIVGGLAGSLIGGSDLATVTQVALAGLVGGLAFWGIVRERPSHVRVDPETFR